MKINVILCGFQWSGCKALDTLIKNKLIKKIYVYTHDAPYYFSDLEELCIQKRISCSKSKISIKNLPFDPDLIISVSYRYKIPSNVLKKCKYQGFNLHPSLLPHYKGCNSVMRSMINNEKYTGFTYHYLTNEFDKGNIIFQKKIKILDYELLCQLYYRVMFESLKKLNFAINYSLSRKKGSKQKEVTINNYFSRKLPFNGNIDNKWDEETIKRFIKSLIFPPLKSALYKNKPVNNFNSFKKLRNNK